MSSATDFLITTRGIMKLHETLLKGICEQYQLTLMEGNIISFLHNNPGLDTAGDIVELRMFSKGNVSQGVNLLMQKGLICGTQDTEDRRKIHLTLLPAAAPITDEIEHNWDVFQKELFSDFSEEEKAMYDELNRRLSVNSRSAIKRRNEHE